MGLLCRWHIIDIYAGFGLSEDGLCHIIPKKDMEFWLRRPGYDCLTVDVYALMQKVSFKQHLELDWK